MKLSSRLALTTAAVAILLFGAGGALVLRNAERNLRFSAERQTLVLGRSLQVAFENALQNSKLDAVAETLRSLAQIRPDVDMFVFDERGNLINSSDVAGPSRGLSALPARLRVGVSPSLVEFVPVDSPENIRVALPLRHETADQASTLVLERPLTTMRKELEETRRSIALLVTGFIAVVVVVSTLIMRIYVGRPLSELVDGMRRMREGNRPQAARQKFRNDEIGEAQRAFAALVAQLDSANHRLTAEQDARQRMTRSLEAADKLITLGQMSAVLAHEIGSPLQVMEGRARACEKP